METSVTYSKIVINDKKVEKGKESKSRVFIGKNMHDKKAVNISKNAPDGVQHGINHTSDQPSEDIALKLIDEIFNYTEEQDKAVENQSEVNKNNLSRS